MTPKTKQIAVFVLIAIMGLVLRIAFTTEKSSWHVDESITLSLVNDNWPLIKDVSYKNRWLPMEEVSRIIFDAKLESQSLVKTLGEVTIQTANDVHPPLYYWLLATVRFVLGAANHLLAGVTLNIILYFFAFFILYSITQKLRFAPLMTAAVLLCFAFARGSISSTLFLRMYELLEVWVLLFAWSAISLVQDDEQTGIKAILPYAGLFFATYLGLITHYYMLFVIAPISVTALVVLIRKKRFSVLLRSLGLVAAGVFLAVMTFPQMTAHLFGSYRSTESARNFSASSMNERFRRLGAFIGILSTDLFSPLLALLAVIAGAVISRVRKTAKPGWTPASGAAIAGFAAVFTLVIVALSSPYQTGRYIAAFLPLHILTLAGLLGVFATGNFTVSIRKLTINQPLAGLVMGIFALAVVFGTAVNPSINPFHEDYTHDASPAYLSDDTPLILVGTPEAWNWKDMLIYKNINLKKQIYITEFDSGRPVEGIVRDIAAKIGSPKVYLVLDDYFRRSPLFDEIGFYGFFKVFEVPAK